MTVPVTVENFVRAETDRMFAALQVERRLLRLPLQASRETRVSLNLMS